MNDKNNIKNSNFMKELPLLNNEIKALFSSEDCERVVLGKVLEPENFNDARLRMYFLSSFKIKQISNIYIVCKSVDNYNEKDCWIILSNKVIHKESIGFPIVYKTTFKNNIYTMAFENNLSKYDFNAVYDYTFSNQNRNDQIKFQQMLISFTLFKHNIQYNMLYFDTYNVPETLITFKIQSLYFNIRLKVLILLSPRTDLFYGPINAELLESKYIDDILFYHNECTKYNFIQYFLTNFSSFLDLSNMPIYNFIIPMETSMISEYPAKGSLVKFRTDDKYYYGILADYYNSIYWIYYIIDSKPKKTDFIQYIAVEREDVFKAENIIPITKGYLIGDMCCLMSN